jgi:sugar lactone lactonase YvrE
MKIKEYKFSHSVILIFGLILIALSFFLLAAAYRASEKNGESFWAFKKIAVPAPFSKVHTILSEREKPGEPFGIAARADEIFFSDGDAGKIWKITNYKDFSIVTDKLDTPSAIVFDKNGDLIVADSGTHAIKRVKILSGEIETIAGVENQKGFADGDAKTALFNAPIGVAVSGDKIFIADTYNDKIRVVENGQVSTLAGGEQGFADHEDGLSAKFDTPCGIAVLKDESLIVADSGNKRLRRIEPNGKTTTFAGRDETEEEKKLTDEKPVLDGQLSDARFIEPLAVAVDKAGVVYVTDANSIRAVGRKSANIIETISDTKRGFADGNLTNARFNRPSGLFADEKGNLFVADAENQAIRVFTGTDLGREITESEVENLRIKPEEFRKLQPPRWSYEPPNALRDIAGTLGEIRGYVGEGTRAWFHNGLDIAGIFGETAHFVRSEKVLRPIAAENFETTRELIRMPTLGYIHINLGRTHDNQIFKDNRFQFSYDEGKRLRGLRVPRGIKFEAGDALGTLNSQSHVHLIAGRSGAEMNALDALTLPNVNDTIAPTIQKVSLFDENWQPIAETKKAGERMKLAGKTRIVARAFDQMSDLRYRKLGVYKIGYQVLTEDKTPLGDINWTISFARFPDEDVVSLVYAPGSQSGYSPRTVFNYIASNEVHDRIARENFFDPNQLNAGNYVLRVYAADYFGNKTFEDVNFEAVKNDINN